MALVGLMVVFYVALVLMALSIVRTAKDADALSAQTFLECARCRNLTDVPVWRHERPYCPSCEHAMQAKVAELAQRYKRVASYPKDAA